jgi:hypothetical protein
MNCKPGDLACIVRVPACEPSIDMPLREQLIGKFVRCVSLELGTTGVLDVWKIREPIRIELPVGNFMLKIDLAAIEDFCLQPVRGVPVHDEQLDEVTT